MRGGEVAKHDQVGGAPDAALVSDVDGALQFRDERGPVLGRESGHSASKELLKCAVQTLNFTLHVGAVGKAALEADVAGGA